MAWGWNASGQLGNGDTTPHNIPGPVPGMTGAVAVAAGTTHSLAALADGSVWAWGLNWRGGLGTGGAYRDVALSPVRVQISGLTKLSGGMHYSLGVRPDGTVWAWGGNKYGQLGDGTTEDRWSPVQVRDLTGVVAVVAGAGTSFALKADGTVWGWGDNCADALGTGAPSQYVLTPIQIVGLSDVVALGTVGCSSLALRSDGTVWTWGDNHYGELGDGTTRGSSDTPVQVVGLTQVTAVATSGTLAVRSDGTVWAWGENREGQLGTGSCDYDRHANPVEVPGVLATTVAVGYYHSVAVAPDGTVRAWGTNRYGQLGIGSSDDACHRPEQVREQGGVSAVTAGTVHTLAIADEAPPTPVPARALGGFALALALLVRLGLARDGAQRRL